MILVGNKDKKVLNKKWKGMLYFAGYFSIVAIEKILTSFSTLRSYPFSISIEVIATWPFSNEYMKAVFPFYWKINKKKVIDI